MELQKYWNIVRSFLWLLILGLALGGAAGYIFSARQTPIYKATTKVLITRGQSNSYSYDSIYYSDQQLAQTYIQLLSTQPVRDAIAERLQTTNIGSISAQSIGDTSVVQVVATNTDPQLAADAANTAVVVLIEKNENLQAGKYSTTEESLQTQITQVENQIAALQTEIDEISQQTVQEQLTQVETQISTLQTEIADLELNIETLEPANSSYNTNLTTEQQEQLSTDKARLAQLRPVLALYQQIYTNLVVLGKPTETGTQDNASRLQSTLSLYQQIYLQLLSNLENVRLAKLQNTPNVTQIEPAVIPSSPISPQPTRSALLGAAIGLMLCAGVVFIISYLDNTVKTPEELEQDFGLTPLGFIPEIQDKEAAVGLYVKEHPYAPVSEAFRSLKTNLEFSDTESKLRVILITSTGAEDGKSTVAVNLAVTYAVAGKKVALLDADLRRPKIHKFLDVLNNVGLSDLFRDNNQFTETDLFKFPVKGLAILTSGKLPPNPAHLLGSAKMAHILEKLRSNVDIVIIDSPPLVVSDAQILAGKADGILIVIQPGKTPRNAVKGSLELLRRTGTKLLGVVMNRIPRNMGYYYGGYNYYSPYTKHSSHYYATEEIPSGRTKRNNLKHAKTAVSKTSSPNNEAVQSNPIAGDSVSDK